MRKVKEILRLRNEAHLSFEKIGAALNIGATTVGDCLSRARALGLKWEELKIFEDSELEKALYPQKRLGKRDVPAPTWSAVHAELRRKGVTLQLLWEEYKEANPSGYQYSQFCYHYHAFAKTVEYAFRNDHRAGEKLFIDYAGMTIPVLCPHGGETRSAQVFLATFGASNFTYAEATWSQNLEDWTSSHMRAFEFFGGAPEILVPDNLRSGVSKPCRYDPDINPTYLELARHYGCVVIPARVRKPKDKAKVENAVLVLERWILASLRNRQFFSLSEVNQAIREGLVKLNARPFKKMLGSRSEHFAKLDKPALKPLPDRGFELSEYKLGKVNINYHVEVHKHNYSVPHVLVQKHVEIRFTRSTVEVFYQGNRVASHCRSNKPYGYTTLEDHMPPAHQHYVSWTPERLGNWAGQIGPKTQVVAETIMSAKPHPQQSYRAVLGLLRMSKTYGNDRLEAACQRALQIGSPSYKSVASILKTNLDRYLPPEETQKYSSLPDHPNIRGREYYVTPQT